MAAWTSLTVMGGRSQTAFIMSSSRGVNILTLRVRYILQDFDHLSRRFLARCVRGNGLYFEFQQASRQLQRDDVAHMNIPTCARFAVIYHHAMGIAGLFRE